MAAAACSNYYGRNLICPFFGQKRGVVFFGSKIAVSVQKSWNGRDGKSETEFSCAAQVELKKRRHRVCADK